MKNYTKILILLAVSVAVFVVALQSRAAKPSDFGLKEGDLISAIFSDDPDVYIINENGFKRLFLNPEIFKFYGHLGGFFNIKLVTPEIRDSFVTSGLFRNCEENDQKVYGVDIDGEDSGQLRWVNTSGAQAVSDDPDFFKKVFCINKKEFDWYPKGTNISTVKDVPKYDRMKGVETVSTQKKLEAKTELKDIGQVVICHYPPGNITAFQTLTIEASALKTHLDHGDTVGVCSTPTLSPTPTPILSVTPTPTPIVTTSPLPTASPSYSPTPTPTPVSTATSTPTPAATTMPPTPTPTPQDAVVSLRSFASINDNQTMKSIMENNKFVLGGFGVNTSGNSIAFKEVTATFINSNPNARLYGVALSNSSLADGSNNVSVLTPNTTITFSVNTSVNTGSEFPLYFFVTGYNNWGQGFDMSGWQIVVNSAKAMLAADSTRSATFTSSFPITLSMIPREISISFLPNSPSGIQSPSSTSSYGFPVMLFNIYSTYPSFSIYSFKVKITGETVHKDGSISNSLKLKFVDQFPGNSTTTVTNWINIPSGISTTMATDSPHGGTALNYNVALLADFNKISNDDEPRPGTHWQIDLEEVLIKNQTGAVLNLLNLPLHGPLLYW